MASTAPTNGGEGGNSGGDAGKDVKKPSTNCCKSHKGQCRPQCIICGKRYSGQCRHSQSGTLSRIPSVMTQIGGPILQGQSQPATYQGGYQQAILDIQGQQGLVPNAGFGQGMGLGLGGLGFGFGQQGFGGFGGVQPTMAGAVLNDCTVNIGAASGHGPQKRPFDRRSKDHKRSDAFKRRMNGKKAEKIEGGQPTELQSSRPDNTQERRQHKLFKRQERNNTSQTGLVTAFDNLAFTQPAGDGGAATAEEANNAIEGEDQEMGDAQAQDSTVLAHRNLPFRGVPQEGKDT